MTTSDLDALFFHGDVRHAHGRHAGHFFHRAAGGYPVWDESIIAYNDETLRRFGPRPCPWTIAELDTGLATAPGRVIPLQGYQREEDQPQGRCCLHHKGGWTAVSFWDRTGDRRLASTSTLVARGTHSFATMIERFRTELPALYARVTAAGPLYGHPENVDPAPQLRIAAPPPVRIAVAPPVA